MDLVLGKVVVVIFAIHQMLDDDLSAAHWLHVGSQTLSLPLAVLARVTTIAADLVRSAVIARARHIEVQGSSLSGCHMKGKSRA